MEIQPFELERWFARHEADADVMLAESGVRSLPAARFDLDAGDLGYVIPTDGDPALRERVAARYDRDAGAVAFTCGTQEANFLVFASLLGPDSHTVTVTPTYQSLHAVPDAFGSVTQVPLDDPDWTLDVEAVREAVTPETDLLVVNNPNNPTGRYHDPAVMDDLAAVAADNDAYLLVDEVYRLLAEDPDPPAAARYDHAISTSGLSKAWGLAGLRFGWVAGPAEVVQAARQWKDYTTISPPAVSQHVARQAFDREADILGENRDLVARNRALVAEFLDRHGLEWSDPVGVNAFVTVPDGFAGGRSFCERVVTEESVVLAPGEAFDQPDYFRLGFGLPTAELEDALDRLDGFLARHA